MKLERILAKIQLQNEADSRQRRQQQRMEAANPTVTQDMRIDQGCSMIRNLREKTKDIKLELEVRKRLKAEEEKHLKAVIELRESRLTPAERKARAQETRRGQILFSRLIPELSPSWREEASEAFRNRKLD